MHMNRLLAAAGATALALGGGLAAAEPRSVSEFQLAPRIADKVAAGEDLEIFVSYHDVSNEFAPFIRAGVERAARRSRGQRHLHRPGGRDADARSTRSRRCWRSMDGLAISSVSTDALAPPHRPRGRGRASR
jgi:simple sugar transport system substrate-binding protein/ribose transport system substrate-binding protein